MLGGLGKGAPVCWYLMSTKDKTLREIEQVVLHPSHVWVEKVTYHTTGEGKLVRARESR